MAVRVVKPKPETDRTREVICPHCKATLEYISSDVQAYYGGKYSLMSGARYWIVCANSVCGKDVVVPSKNW